MTRIDPAGWVAFCAQPTEENFSPFYNQSKGLVWTLCWRILRDEDEARDAFQGVYARLLAHAQAGATAEGSGAPVNRLIYTLAIREANRLRLRRRRRGQREVVMDALAPQPSEDPSALETAARAQARARIEALVAALPEKYRLPLELHYFHGIKQEEIAAMIGRSQGTVSQRIARGLRLLEPLAQRAGLGRAAVALGAMAAGASLCTPPSAQAAAVVFAKAQALIAEGVIAGGVGLGAIKMLAGAGLAQGKAAILAALTLSIVVAGTFFGAGLHDRYKSKKFPITAQRTLSQNKSDAPSVGSPNKSNVAIGTSSTQADPLAMQAGSALKRRSVPGAVISGLILSPAGRPVAGVRVRAVKEDQSNLKIETLSDGRGQYRLEGLPQRERLAVVAEPRDYAWQARLVQPEASTPETRCDLVLEPAGVVAITVTDTAGHPLEAGVFVNDQTSAYLSLHLVTDKQGHGLMRNLSPTRPVGLYANKPGYASCSKLAQFPAGSIRAEVKFELPPVNADQHVLTGVVTGPQDTPLPGITIQRGVIRDKNAERTVTDPEGRYRLAIRNPEPRQGLTAWGKGWATQSRYIAQEDSATSAAARAAALDFKMQPGHWLAGVVVDDRGRPLKDIDLDLTIRSPGAIYSDVQKDKKTDAQGRFRIEDLPAEGLGLIVFGQGFPQEEVRNVSPDRELRIVLKPAGRIRGRVIDKASQKPVTSFSIRIAGFSATGDRAYSGQNFSNPDGRFELDGLKQEQPCEFTIEALGYPPHVEKNIPVGAPDSSREWPIEISAGRQLHGILLDRDNGALLTGAEVIYSQVNEHTMIPWSDLHTDSGIVKTLQRQITDSKGAFTFSIAEERGTILILPQKHQRLVIRPAEREKYLIGDTLVIKVGPAATLTGKALLDGPRPGAFIQLLPAEPRSASAFEDQQTDRDGSYRFEGLNPGKYILTMQRGLDPPTYHTYYRSLRLAEGEQKALNIGDDLGACTLSGTIFDHGRPVPNVIVELTPRFDWEYQLISGHTNAQGLYTIQGLRPGAYDARLSQEARFVKPGEKQLSLKATIQVAAGSQHDFEFKRGRAVTARLVFPFGEPSASYGALNYVLMRLKNMPRPAKKTTPNGIDAQVQGRIEGRRLTFEGRFKGEYLIELSYGISPHTGDLLLPARMIDNLSGDQDLGEIPLPATGQVRVHVNYDTPAPELPPQVIAFITRAGRPSDALATLYLDPRKTEQSAGPVPVGTQAMCLFAPGYKADPTSVTVNISRGSEASPLTFKLSPEAVVSGADSSR